MKRQLLLALAAVVAVTLVSVSRVHAQAPGSSAGDSPNYVVGPSDRLRITVWNQADVSGEYHVERDGTFTFPLIGKVSANGLTLEKLEAELRRLLANGFYRNPQVTVAIIEYRSKRVFLMGELRTPGTYPITGDTSLIEALAKAGSTTSAAADHALIIRSAAAEGPVLPGQDESAEVTKVDLRRLNGGQLSADFIVRDGDTVFVPRASTVYVYGQVRTPGSYAIGQDTSVRQALSLAGGVSDYGAANRVKVLRVVNGKESELKVKMNDLVQAGDTVVVPERLFSDSVDRNAAIAPDTLRGPERNPDSMIARNANVLDYLRVIYRRRWVGIAVFAAVVIAAAVYIYVADRVYEAQATILIDSDEPKVVQFETVVDSSGADYFQTQQELLQSRLLAQRTVAALKLAQRGEFGAGSEPAATDAVRGGLRIQPVRGSRMVQVRFRSTSPALAAEIANGHARAYIEQDLEHRFRASSDATDWLRQQLKDEQRLVEQADSALQTYREQHDALSLKDGQDIVVRKLTDLNAAVTRAKTNRIEKQAQNSALAAVEHDRAALDSFPAILSNPFIQQLKGNLSTLQREYAQLAEALGDRHPTLIEKGSAVTTTQQRLDAEVTRVVESVKNAFNGAVAEETSLVSALEQQKREAVTLNRQGIEYAALEREAQSVRLVYQNLLERAEQTGVASELRTSNTRIVDQAQVPVTPVLPRTLLTVVMAVLSGGLLAVGAVFVNELVDDRIETPEDLRGEMGFGFLGLVPELRKQDHRRGSLLHETVPPVFAEAVRALRTLLISSTGEKRHSVTVLVASSAEGEGKTLVASNLAIALAQARQRVLLIDADLRRPSIHRVLGQSLEPGLSDVLAGSSSLAECLQASRIPGLTILSAGAPSVEASELLSSDVLTGLFDVMEQNYSWVIVDSPPVLSVTDATVLAGRVTGVLFVVGSGMTSSRAVRLAVEELQQGGGKVLGAVLNRADLEHHAYYFSPYAKAGYSAPPPHALDERASPASLGG